MELATNPAPEIRSRHPKRRAAAAARGGFGRAAASTERVVQDRRRGGACCRRPRAATASTPSAAAIVMRIRASGLRRFAIPQSSTAGWRGGDQDIPVTIEADIRTPTSPPLDVQRRRRNPREDLASEVVILGAHFDSWHASTGATDTIAGSAGDDGSDADPEAERGDSCAAPSAIGLWTGEEQGLIGSRDYVKAHFGGLQRRVHSAQRGAPSREHRPQPRRPRAHSAAADAAAARPAIRSSRSTAGSRLLQHRNGTGAISGVYLQQKRRRRAIFREVMEPFRSSACRR